MKTRPKLEDMIPVCLEGKEKQTVFDFVEYCKVNKIAHPWGTSNIWYIKVKGKHIGNLRTGGIHVGNIKMDDNTWYISLNMKTILPYKELIKKENLKKIIWHYVKHCEGCLSTCKPGITMTIFDKKFDNVCVGQVIRFWNPNRETVDSI